VSYNVPKIINDHPPLRLVERPELTPDDLPAADLEEERRLLREQVEAEEFWAGRNLAGRNSARWAA
jgi:hypothetical protein